MTQPFAGSRRSFLKQTATAAAVTSFVDWRALAADARPSADGLPWYRRAVRWGQTNITERDPTRYDIA